MTWVSMILLLPAAAVGLLTAAMVFHLKTSGGDSGPLRAAVKKRLHPRLGALGFTSTAHSMRSLFQRTHGDCIQVVEIQWDKHHSPIFRINFGEAEASSIPRGEAPDLHMCRTSGSLERKRGHGFFGMDSWYQLRKPLLVALRTRKLYYKPDEVADQVLNDFSEVEEWLSDSKLGPHMRLDIPLHVPQKRAPADGPASRVHG